MNDRNRNGHEPSKGRPRDELRGRGTDPGVDHRRDGASRSLADARDYDRDRYGYDREGSTDRQTTRLDTHDRSRTGHDDYAGRESRGHDYGERAYVSDGATPGGGWGGRAAGGESPRYGGVGDDRRWQGPGSPGWESSPHARAPGEAGFGAEYRTHDGYGAAEQRAPEGRGPKGYVRSDERMKEEICERLASQSHDWSDVEVHVSDAEVTLTGSVRSRELKHEAERVAARVRGIADVSNQLRVKRDGGETAASAGVASDDARRTRRGTQPH